MKTKLTYGSLFSGVGGFDMGFDQEGYECVFQVEWDKHCQKILAKHWPEVPKWGDVCDVNGADLPPCDVLIFGSPCQDLSVAGKRAGLQDGDRSSMFFQAVRIIKEMRDATNSIYPRATIWENVPGALSSNKGADFGVVLSSLADIGAITQEYAVLDAQYFGVPQRRRRIFLVSIFDSAASERCPDPLLPVIQGSRGDFKKSRTARKNATGHATPSVDSSGQWAAGSTDEDILSTSVCSKWAKGSGGPSGSEHYNMVVEGEPNILFGGGSFAQFVEGQVSTLKVAGGDLGGGSENLVVQNNLVNPEDTIGTLTAGMFRGPRGTEGVDSNHIFPVSYSTQEAFVKSRRAQSDTDDETWVEGDVTPTLNAFDNGGETRATVLMPFVFDGTRHDDFRMDTETVPTLKQRMGTGGGQVPMLAEPIVYDGYNQKLDDSGIHRSLRIGRDSSDFVAQPTYAFNTQFGSNAAIFEDTSPTLKSSQQPPSVSPPSLAVRRLTPLECERLMGWPDDHTRWKADGTEQADTHRYKQCGNGVATPVAKWIAKHLKNILLTNDDQ